MTASQKSVNNKMALSKRSEICFYIGLFFFIFSLVLTITLAVKNSFVNPSTIGWVLIGIIIGFAAVGIIFLGLSLLFFLKLRKISTTKQDATTASPKSTSPAPSVKVIINNPNPSVANKTIRPSTMTSTPVTNKTNNPNTRMIKTADGRYIPVKTAISQQNQGNKIPMMRTPDGKLVPVNMTASKGSQGYRPTVSSGGQVRHK